MNYKGTVGQANSEANVYSPWYLGNSNTFQWSVTHILLCRSAQLSEQQADTRPTGSQGNNLAYRELIWKKGQCRMVSDWVASPQRCAMVVAASTSHVPGGQFKYYQQMTHFKIISLYEM